MSEPARTDGARPHLSVGDVASDVDDSSSVSTESRVGLVAAKKAGGVVARARSDDVGGVEFRLSGGDDVGGVEADLDTSGAGGVDARLEAGRKSKKRPPTHRVTVERVDPAARRRVEIEALDPEITLGTQSSQSFRTSEVEKKENQEKLKKAFVGFEGMLREIGEFNNLQYSDLNLRTLVTTIHKPDGTEVTLGLDDIKRRVLDARTRANPGVNPRVLEARVNAEINAYVSDLRHVAVLQGMTNVFPWATRGEDARGNFIGGRALDVQDNPLLQKKKCGSLADGLNEKVIVSVLDQVKGRDDAETVEKRRQAADRILQAEAFFIKIREKLTNKITKIDAELAKPTIAPAKREELTRRRQHYDTLKNQLSWETNRYALYTAAAFNDPAHTPMENAETCYHGMCEEFYKVANEERKGNLSYKDFMTLPEFLPLRQHAGEIASTLLSDATEYKGFCHKHDIVLKQDHINVFTLQALKGDLLKHPIKFNAVSIGFNRAERRELNKMIEEAHTASETEVGNRLRAVDAGDTLSPEERLKAAVTAKKGVEPLFSDPTGSYEGSFSKGMSKAASAAARGFQWFWAPGSFVPGG